MAFRPSLLRRSAALVILLAAGLGLGFWWSESAAQPGLLPPLTLSTAENASHAELPGPAIDGPLSELEPKTDKRSSFAPVDGQALAKQTAELRLRFLSGSSGVCATDLEVRLYALDDASGEVPLHEDAKPSALGRSDAQGFFEVPQQLRERGFAIGVFGSDGRARQSSPAQVTADAMAQTNGICEVRVFWPWACIEALVLDEHGQPVPGASVQFDFESPAVAFSTRDTPSTIADSDERGLARLELFDPASVGGRLHIKAEREGEWHSESIEIAPPLKSARVELHLSTSAGATLLVANSAGLPLHGVMARLEQLELPFANIGRSTNRGGAAKFKPLEPGRYVASAEDPSTGATARLEFVLGSCQMVEIDLRLPPSQLPLAVSGRVCDLDGKPITWLSVSICVEGREEARLATDAEGHFSYHRTPCERLRVRAKAAFDGPQVEPEMIDAKFGSENLVCVLGDAPRFGYVALRVVDRESKAALANVTAAVFRDSSAERIGGVLSALSGAPLYLASDEDGNLFVPSGIHLPRAHLVVEKRGFVRRELDLSDVSQLELRDGRPTLELERGYLQRWVVLDGVSGAPVPGAIATHGLDPFTENVLLDDERWQPSAPSDARGVLELSLPQAPRRISIQAPGYRPRSVEVGQVAQVFGATLSLGEPLVLDPSPPGRD